jgi:hypothetical protein
MEGVRLFQLLCSVEEGYSSLLGRFTLYNGFSLVSSLHVHLLVLILLITIAILDNTNPVPSKLAIRLSPIHQSP